MGNGFSVGTNLSYDDAFDGRVSADIIYRFATPEAVNASIKKAGNAPTINRACERCADNRDVRVHDSDKGKKGVAGIMPFSSPKVQHPQ